MDIRIYDFEFNLLAIAPRAISSVWNLKYNAVGTFEGHFALSDEIAKILLENQYIVLCQGDKQAICTGKITDKDLLICGRSVNWILTKRVLLPFNTKDFFNNEFRSPKEIVAYLLNFAYKVPPLFDENGDITLQIDQGAIVENLTFPQAPGGARLERHFWRNSANTLSEVICDLCELSGCGHRIVFDTQNKKWVFNFIDGSELLPIISEGNKNAAEIKMTEDIDNYASSGFYETSTGEDGTVSYSYIKKDNKQGIYRWEKLLSASGKSKAVSALKEKSVKTCAQLKLKNLSFGNDFDLGDIMRVQIDYGNFRKDIRQRIVGVCIKDLKSGYSQDITFALL